jgi:hypothetical protein
MDSSYRQEPLDGGQVRFTVTPAPVPRASGGPVIIAVIFGLFVVGTMSRNEGALGLIIRLAIAIFGGIKIHRWLNAWFAGKVDKVRSPGGTFVASAAGIETSGGVSIPRDQLHRLIIRNGVPDVGEASVVVNDGSVYGGMQAGAANDRAANRAKAARISYMLCAEHGGRSTTLGGGMTEVTAHGLLTDVRKLLGTSVAVG